MYQKSTDNDYFVPGFSHPLHKQTVAPSLSIITTRGGSMSNNLHKNVKSASVNELLLAAY